MILILTMIIGIFSATSSFAEKPKIISSRGKPVLKQKTGDTWILKTGKNSNLKIILQNKTIINIGNDSQLILKKDVPRFKEGRFEISTGKLKVYIGSASFILKEGFTKFKISSPSKLPASVRKKMMEKMVREGKEKKSKATGGKEKSPSSKYNQFKFPEGRFCISSGQIILKKESSCFQLEQGKCTKQLNSGYCYQDKYLFAQDKREKAGFLQVTLPAYLYPSMELDLNSFLPSSVRNDKSKGKGESKGDDVSASGAGGSMCLNSSSSSSASDVNDSNQTNVKPTPTTKLIIKIDLPQMVQE